MNRKLSIVFLLLIQCSISVAQNYIYSVTTGTAWSREVYPKEEQEQREAMRKGQPLPGAPNFGETFRLITYTYNKSNTYNDSIFYNLSHQEWIGMFKRRAFKYSHFYTQNNKVLDELKAYFSQDNVPDAAYDSLFFYTRNMYHRNINDIFLYEQLLNILLPHYEEQQDIDHLIFCYMCSGLYNYQCARMGDKEARLRSERYYHKVLNLKDQFTHFADPLNRFYFIAAYANLAILHTQAGNISLTESLHLTQSVKKTFNTPEAQQIFRSDSLLTAFATWSFDLFRLRGIATYISQNLNNTALRDQLYQAYKDFKDENNNDFASLKNRYYAKLPYDDYLIEAYMGHISWNEAYSKLEAELLVDPELKLQANNEPGMKINYLNNLFETTITILDRSTLTYHEKRARVTGMLTRMLRFISHYPHSRYPFEKGMILANIAQKAELLQYLDSKERQELLFRLIVLEQPTTYVHVMMVAALAESLTAKMIDRQPEFFLSLPNISSVKDVQQHKDSLLDFVRQAAIYHDLGKITMPTVVNNCIRKIFNHEYNVLQLHPEKSKTFFAIDPTIKPFQDIALGHHKWYNGDGYPASFKNRESPYYPIICLITVCDCLDAATENIGRNYHIPKPFEKVLSEFIEDSGTRYHPQIIDFICKNKDVQEDLKKIVSDGRYDHYFKLYTGYMNK